MDEFLLYGGTFDLCLENLSKIIHRCEEVDLVLNWEKYHFMVQEGVVFGHMVSQWGIQVDKAKIEVIERLPLPTCVKSVRSFLGHVGLYRRFIKDFSKTAKLLTLLLAKDTPFIFSNECLKAFYRSQGLSFPLPLFKRKFGVFLSKLCVIITIMRLGRFWATKRQEALCYLLC